MSKARNLANFIGIPAINSSADATAITISSSEDLSIGSASNHAGARVVINDTPPTAFGNPMFQLGQETFTASGIYSIGLGFTAGSYTNPPAEIAAISTSSSGGTTADILFGTRSVTTNTAVTERMRIKSNGNVGIGETNPAALLHINGSGDAIRVTSTNSGAGGAQVDLLHFSASPADGDDHASINFGGYYSGSTSAYGSAIKSNWTDVSAREACLKFYTRDDNTFYNHMQLNHFGHLLVGREDNSNHSSRVKIVNGGGSGYEASLDFCYEGKDTVRAKINTSASGGTLIFNTFDSDGLQPRMHLLYNGKLGLGQSSPTTALHAESSSDENKRAIRVSYNSSYYGEMVQQGAAGTLFRQYGGANFKWNSGGTDYMLLATNNLHVAGSVTANSSSVSDERFKDNIQTVTGALDKVKALRGVTYTWNKGSRKDETDYGVIAQEVEKVIPEIVHDMTMPLLTNDEETVYKTVDYSRLSAVLINAVKELEARLAALEAK